MSQRSQPQVVRNYLSELEVALAGVPADVARDILDGVAEELAGLDPAAAATRIEDLGDPAFIAAEARAESDVSGEGPPTKNASTAPRAAPGPPASDSRWYIVLASLLVALGGVILPLLGWVFGIAMVWVSKTWRTWEKWTGTLISLLVPVLFFLGWLATGLGWNVFGALTWWHLATLCFFIAPFIAGIWLLWRGLRRK